MFFFGPSPPAWGLGLLVVATVIVLLPESIAAVQCVTCSYTFAGGDGSTDYQCVDDVYNFTKTSSASCTSGLCTIRTVYTNGFGRINSLYRGCGTSVVTGCDQPESVYPTCTITCSTPQCNDQNGDLWPSFRPSDPNGGGGGGGSSSVTATYISFVVPLYFLLNHLICSNTI